MSEPTDQLAEAITTVRARLSDRDYLDLVEAMQALAARLLMLRKAHCLSRAEPEIRAECGSLVQEAMRFCDSQASAFCAASISEACGDLFLAVDSIRDAGFHYERALSVVHRLSHSEQEQLDEEPTRWGWDSNLDALQAVVSQRVWRVASRGARRGTSLVESRLNFKVRVVGALSRDLH